MVRVKLNHRWHNCSQTEPTHATFRQSTYLLWCASNSITDGKIAIRTHTRDVQTKHRSCEFGPSCVVSSKSNMRKSHTLVCILLEPGLLCCSKSLQIGRWIMLMSQSSWLAFPPILAKKAWIVVMDSAPTHTLKEYRGITIGPEIRADVEVSATSPCGKTLRRNLQEFDIKKGLAARRALLSA
eukprot:4603812-Amphidinium_carterae.1